MNTASDNNLTPAARVRPGFDSPVSSVIAELGFDRWLESVFLGRHRLMNGVRAAARLAAQEDLPVLLTGETGTGKDLIAQAIHAGSRRCRKEPHVVAVGGLGETAWSVLFGHRRGSFTSADQDHQGLFRLAHGSTLILEDVADLPAKVQPMLLRAVEQGIFRPLGEDREVTVNVRILSTTNISLATEVASSRFRADLYQRISALRIVLPPLRSHLDDLDELVPHFLVRAAGPGRACKRIAADGMALLKDYSWPRNVRELEHLMYRATLETTSPVIGARDLQRMIAEDVPLGPRRPVGRPGTLIPREEVIAVLQASGGNKRETARRLGISPATLYSLLDRHRIECRSSPREFERT